MFWTLMVSLTGIAVLTATWFLGATLYAIYVWWVTGKSPIKTFKEF